MSAAKILLLILALSEAMTSSYAYALSPLEARKNLIQYATAFESRPAVEGQTCLVLGFKSTFQNGLCRLAQAPASAAYRSYCEEGSVPCNPAIYGRSESTPVLCVKKTGSSLSSACSQQSNQMLSQKSPESVFSGSSSMDVAKDFIDALCNDLKTGVQTSLSPIELKSCLSYRNQLRTARSNVVEAAVFDSFTKSISSKASEPQACAAVPAPNLSSQTTNQIGSMVRALSSTVGPKEWMACIKTLQKFPEIPSEKARRYWNQIDGKNTFGMQCERPKNDGYFQYAFLSENGFTGIEYPRVKVQTQYRWGSETPVYPSKVASFVKNGKTYLMSVETSDMFNLVSETSATKREWQTYQKALASRGLNTRFVVSPESASGSSSWMKSCVSSRLADFIGMTMPRVPISNAEQMQKILARAPQCSGIIDDSMMSKAFTKTYQTNRANP
jgi:hypothetical protein